MLARRIIAITGFVGASACIVIFTGIEDPVRAMFVLGMAGFFNDFVMPAARERSSIDVPVDLNRA